MQTEEQNSVTQIQDIQEIANKPVIKAEDVAFGIEKKNLSSLIFFLENQTSNSCLYFTPDLHDFYHDFKHKINKNKIIYDINKYKNEIFKHKFLLKNIFCVLDFSGFEKYEDSVTYDFYGALKKRSKFNCVLTILKNINNLLAENGNIKLFILNKNPKINIIKLFLNCAYFDNIVINKNIIIAQKKSFENYTFDHGNLTFKETINIEDVKKIQNFAKLLFKENNFDISIDSLFTPNSSFYYCYRTDTEEIVNFMRYTWYLPKYPMPCMLAQKKDSQEHIKLWNSEKKLYGEIFAPFNKKLSAVKAYKEFVKNLLQYCLNNNIYKVYTTYNIKDLLSGIVFNKYFGFEKSDISLIYGDFKNTWALIKGEPKLMEPILNKFIGIKERIF